MYASPKAKAQSPKGKAYMMTYGEDFPRVITHRTRYRSGRKVIIGRQECVSYEARPTREPERTR